MKENKEQISVKIINIFQLKKGIEGEVNIFYEFVYIITLIIFI